MMQPDDRGGIYCRFRFETSNEFGLFDFDTYCGKPEVIRLVEERGLTGQKAKEVEGYAGIKLLDENICLLCCYYEPHRGGLRDPESEHNKPPLIDLEQYIAEYRETE